MRKLCITFICARMTDELKDQRVPIMMSPSELKALDDWMFGKRIRSRGEAIRRLCQMGMLVEGHLRRLMDTISEADRLNDEDMSALKTLNEPGAPAAVAYAVARLRTFHAQFEAKMITTSILGLIEAYPFLASRNVEDAMAEADRIREDIKHLDLSTEEGRKAVLKISAKLGINSSPD